MSRNGSRTFAGFLAVAQGTGAALLLAPALHGQVEAGRFVGRITDTTGAVIPQATVTVRNTGTNIAQTAQTNASGEFVITPVSAGSYTVTLSATGFQTTTTNKIEVEVGQIVREDLQLKVGSSSETVTVTTAAPLLTTDSATVGQVITNQQLTALPLNGRGFFRLAELTPGAALLPPTGNSLAIRPEVVNGNTISGIRGSAISFLLDYGAHLPKRLVRQLAGRGMVNTGSAALDQVGLI